MRFDISSKDPLVAAILRNLRIKDLRIIGQSAEREFIFCYHIKKRRIICFDQHAVHERIRYERILNKKDPSQDLEDAKSRACHGAIRFGDKLSLELCHKLIDQLLKCKIPYRCAHFRRSVSVLDCLDFKKL